VRTAGGRHAVVDVPVEAAGAVQSWLLVEATDLDAAVSVARTCPEARHGEVRVLLVDPRGRRAVSDAADAARSCRTASSGSGRCWWPPSPA
jgi:hypothetical protein